MIGHDRSIQDYADELYLLQDGTIQAVTKQIRSHVISPGHQSISQ
jgi:hypothetical protein